MPKTKYSHNTYIDLSKVKYYTQKNGVIQGYYRYKDENNKWLKIAKYGRSEKEIINKFKKSFTCCNSKESAAICSPFATFRQLSLHWLSEVKRYQVKAATLELLRRVYNNYLDKPLGSKAVAFIKAYELQELINVLYCSGLARSSVKKVKSFLCSVFNYALAENIINHNPALCLFLPRNDELKGNPFLEKDELFSSNDIALFDKTAKLKNNNGEFTYRYGNIFMFMLNTGLRRGEMLALKWKDVDFEKRVLYVYKTVTYGSSDSKDELLINESGKIVHTQQPEYFVQSSPKSISSIRKVYLLPEAVKYLSEFKEAYYKGEDKYILYPQIGNGDTPLSSSSFYRAFQLFKKASGVTNKAGIHSLRKTYATELYNSNIRLKSISRALGHSSTTVTTDIYVKYSNTDNYDDAFAGITGIRGL